MLAVEKRITSPLLVCSFALEISKFVAIGCHCLLHILSYSAQVRCLAVYVGIVIDMVAYGIYTVIYKLNLNILPSILKLKFVL